MSLELPSPVPDVPGRFPAERAQTLLGVLETLEAIADEPRAHGVLLELRGAPGGLAAAQSLRRALDAVRARGKAIAALAESLDLVSLYVASRGGPAVDSGDRPRATRSGCAPTPSTCAICSRGSTCGPSWCGSARTRARARCSRTSRMSDEQREQLEAIVSDGFDALVEGIAAGRGRTDRAGARVDRPRAATPPPRRARPGSSTAAAYRDELEDRLGELASRLSPRARAARARATARALWALRANARSGFRAPPPRIACCSRAGRSRAASTRAGSRRARPRRLLDALARDARVRGVVLRIDSPGGDALASDLLWRAVRALRREKPVVASLAEVAASGGYYLACAADCVIAERSSLTGSIGVIGGKLDLSGLFRRIGVGLDAVERGARAGMHSAARGFTDEERELVRGEMRALYETFVARVAEGRGLAAAAVERAAQGRVFTGGRALALGLVDALGGPLEALAEVRRRAGLRRAEPVLVDLHPRVSALRALTRWLR